MFVEETAGLVKHGLKSAYIEKQENLTVYKGKLLVNSHIKHKAAHKERFSWNLTNICLTVLKTG